MLKKLAINFRRTALSLVGGLILSVGVGTQPMAAPAPDPEAAASFVSGLAHQAMDILRQTSEADTQKRQAVFEDLLTNGFDLHAIGRLILGKHWRSATKKQREEYVRLFPAYVIRTYSSMLGGYSDEVFQVGKAKPKGRADMEVDSKIIRSDGPPIPVEWRIRMIGQNYRVIDVKVEGVSMVITKRSEFDSVIKNKGIDGLLEALQPRT